MLYKYFQDRYCLGTAGVIGACCIASLTVTNIKPVSLMMVAPSGQLKSQITQQLARIFPDNVVVIPSRFTPFGLSERMGKSRLNNRTWIDNDMVRTFDGLSQTKTSELVGWLAEMMSEGRAASSTARDTELEARMNLLGNIALISYRDLERKFISSTLNERILQFGYYVEKDEVRHKSRPSANPVPLLKLEPSCITLSGKDKKRIYRLADSMAVIAHYEQQSLRTDEIIAGILAGHAKLNGRNRLARHDYDFIVSVFEHFKRVI